MKYILKPKWKKCVHINTIYCHKTIKERLAEEDETYRYEEFKVELAEGIDVEELKSWDEFDLDDTDTFLSFEMLDNPVSGDVTYSEWDIENACTDEEREAIEEGNIWDLEDWKSFRSFHSIQSECEIVPVS
jgi:hypothetical protein